MALIYYLRPPWGPVLGMATLSLLFLTRTNLWPVIPGVLLVLLVQASDLRQRLLLVAAAGAVPVAFFLSDTRHLKVLAYVPVVGRLVRSLGYPAGWSLIGHPARMYECWTFAALFLCAIVIVRRPEGGGLPFLREPRPAGAAGSADRPKVTADRANVGQTVMITRINHPAIRTSTP